MVKKIDLKDIVQDALDDSIQQISASDATFLYAETPKSPMHVGSVIIVEGSLKFNDFKKIIASKLHYIPKFRKRLLNVPMHLDFPYWVDDSNFDLDLHLHRTKLPDPSNWKTLREITASLFSTPLDLRRPLWSIHFIEGIDEIPQIPKGSVAILSKVHHVMIDGNSGVGIMGIVFDKDSKNKDVAPPEPKEFEPEPLPDELTLLLKSAYGFLKNPLKVPKLVGKTALSLIKSKVVKKVKGQGYNSNNTLTVPKTIFNGSISAKRTWGTAILSFDRINVLRKLAAVSINDIILTICAGAIRKYLIEIDKLPTLPLVANVPISIRVKDSSESKKMNNQISNMLVQIATHIKNPTERLEFIQEQTQLGKTKHKAVGAKSLAQMANSVPFGLANLAAGVYSKYNIKELHRPPFNVTITNVPGPSGILYIKGHKIVSLFGLTPVVDGFGLIIAAFSYNGQVTITTTSDSNTMPDVDKFSRYIREAANELEEVIQKRGKKKPLNTIIKIKSTPFFTALKKHSINHPKFVKNHSGLFQIEVVSNDKISNWLIDFTKKEILIKKQKSKDAKVILNITDTILFKLYKQELLLEELIIQKRIKLKGTKKETNKLLKMLHAFLNR
ncbi:MAG: wax ester/triacylglycerol synthase family O-acyltransferase [Flavobacteriaceae bacterium]|nr:wax ester/triacylglycerol synthase family O-acyltransferase [Flavobacteriaceae bacterium]